MSYVRIFQDYLAAFAPHKSAVQEAIYNSFLQRLEKHYQTELDFTSLPIKDTENFLFQRVISLFYPFEFLSRSPFFLPDIESAVNIINRAYLQKEICKILIYGDRDVDGLTSSVALRYFFVKEMGFSDANVVVLLPREEDKYGITDEVAERILEYDFNILFTLDCGSANQQSLAHIKQQRPKIETLIIDHHFIPIHEQDYPEVDAFINPKRLHKTQPERENCTAVLVYKLIEAVIFSFTSEYKKTYALNEEFFFRNGITGNLAPTDAVQISVESCRELIQKSWSDLILTHSNLKKYNDFCHKAGIPIGDGDKLRAIQVLYHANLRAKLNKILPLAAIGTIGDMMPLLHDNRIIVNTGLQYMSQNNSQLLPGLRALLSEFDLGGKIIQEQDIGFTLSPALNAAGRLGNALQAYELLSEDNELNALKLAKSLRETNERRKLLSQQATELLTPQLSQFANQSAVVIADDRVHRGISGLIANKLTEIAQKPVIIMVNDGDCLRGSARSYQNENVFAAVSAAKEFLLQFGGHRQAAGFSIQQQNVGNFTKSVLNYFNNEPKQSDEENFYEFEPYTIDENEVDERLWQQIEIFSPYGILNPHPVLKISSGGEIEFKQLGKSGDHVKVDFNKISNQQIEGVWFFHGGQTDLLQSNDRLFIFAEPHKNSFRGKTKLQLKIKKVHGLDPK